MAAADNEVGEEEEDVAVDDEDTEDSESEDSDDDEDSDAEGGGADADEDSDENPQGPAVASFSGKAILDALFQDPEAQSLLKDTLEDYQREMAEHATLRERDEALAKLVEAEDWEGIGKAVVQRQREAEAHNTVAEQIQREMFKPVYADIFASPELQNLSAEEKSKLHIDNYRSPAEHVKALTEFITGKRTEAAIEAEVSKRVEAALAAKANGETAGKAKNPSLGGRSPAAVGEVDGNKKTSADYLKAGLRAIVNPDQDDDEL